MNTPRRQPLRGFTLIEFLGVLAVAAVLLGAAAPDFSRTLAQHAAASQAIQFMAALRFARSEAVSRGTSVIVCASDSAAPGPLPRCQAKGPADWRSGWIVFADAGSSGQPATSDVLRVQQPFERSGGIAGTRSAMRFTPAGFSTDAAGHLRFEPPGGERPGGAKAVLVCVSKQGKPRVAPGAVCE
jgi:type IV fimbrial biogenesis protein FimT